MKGIHVPIILLNISKLLFIKRATTIISIKITKTTNIMAVSNGVVKLKKLK
jgi:hypothetical protein